MATTIYTYDGQILKESGSGKWLIEPPPHDEVLIGNQIWKNQNLAIDDGGVGISTRTVNFGLGDVVEYYYTWDAAVRVASSISGWHLPTASEWNTLANAVGGGISGGVKLKSTYGWNDDGNGTDDYGFTGLPAGYIMDGGHFVQFGNYACFWTADPSQTSERFANGITLMKFNNKINSGSEFKTDSYSIRLVKDAT